MIDLYPTKTRLALLQAVADGDVFESRLFPYDSYERVEQGRNARTSRCSEARRAGWIELEPIDDASRWQRKWRLTDAGRAVLDGAR